MADAQHDDHDVQPLSPLTKKRKRNRLYYEANKENLKSKKSCIHFKLEVFKDDEVRLESIREKLGKIKGELNLNKSRTVNADLIEALLDNWIVHHPSTTAKQVVQSTGILSGPPTPEYDEFVHIFDDTDGEDSSTSSSTRPLPPLSLLNPKTQLHSLCQENDEIYLVCGTALVRLFKFLTERGNSCHCGGKYDFSTVNIARVTKNSHCAKVVFRCRNKHSVEWFSSSMMSSRSAGKYYVNVRLVYMYNIFVIFIKLDNFYSIYIIKYIINYSNSNYRNIIHTIMHYSLIL